jgi:hypothetical protein
VRCVIRCIASVNVNVLLWSLTFHHMPNLFADFTSGLKDDRLVAGPFVDRLLLSICRIETQTIVRTISS